MCNPVISILWIDCILANFTAEINTCHINSIKNYNWAQALTYRSSNCISKKYTFTSSKKRNIEIILGSTYTSVTIPKCLKLYVPTLEQVVPKCLQNTPNVLSYLLPSCTSHQQRQHTYKTICKLQNFKD